MPRYQTLLKPNSIYRLTNFYATDNKIMFRVSVHDFTLCFTDLTTIVELPETANSIEAQLFRFHSFSELRQKRTKKEISMMLSATLNSSTATTSTTAPHLSMVFRTQTGTPTKLQCISNLETHMSLSTMSPSRVFFDSEVAPTREYLTWLGDNANSLAIVNTSQVTKLETLTIAEFIRSKPSQVAFFICVATITDVMREGGWFYISCIGCNKKCYRGPTSLVCTHCPNQNVVGIIKYKVEFSAHDSNDTATFVFLDDAGTQVAGRSATKLMDSLSKDNGSLPGGGEVPFPECFSSAIGKTHKFMIKVTEYNFRATRQTITVTKILDSQDLPQEETAATIEATSGPNNTKALPLTNTHGSTTAETSSSQNQKKMKAPLEETSPNKTGQEIVAHTASTKPKRARRNA